jgi:phosphoribosylformimino-5-aminoimidazole carboxamide ribotide isomerase
VRVIGVIDLRDGQAVHARGGIRGRYSAVHIPGDGRPGDAASLAQWYAHLGVHQLYVADLDAIAGRAPQDPLVHALTASRTVWLDAGITSIDGGQRAVALGVRHPIVGLETLTSYRVLGGICAALPQAVAFSLDLRDGQPVVAAGSDVRAEPPQVLAERAAGAGAHAIIVLDLARIGGTAGVDVRLIERIRTQVPDVMLLAGGGIRGRDDLCRLADAGCDAALVATALLDGRIGAADVTAVNHRSVVRQTAD